MVKKSRTIKTRRQYLLKLRKYAINSIINNNCKNFNKLYQLLSDFTLILDKFDIPYWIIGGAMLGCYRNNSMIPWDDDIDIGIDVKHKILLDNSKLRSILKTFNLKLRDLDPESIGTKKLLKVIPANKKCKFNKDTSHRSFIKRGKQSLEIFWYIQNNNIYSLVQNDPVFWKTSKHLTLMKNLH